MKYHEKNQLVEESLALIESGNSLSHVENFLKDKGYYNKDIDSIVFSSKSVLSKKYNSIVINSLYKDSSCKNNKEIQHLNDKVIELMEKKGEEKIKSLKKSQIRSMILKGIGDNEILSKSVDRFFTREEGIEEIEFVEKSISEQLKRERNEHLFVGLGALLVGLGITVVTVMFPIGNKVMLFYGLIIFGFVKIVMGLGTTKKYRDRVTE